jgi:hypothetical protein
MQPERRVLPLESHSCNKLHPSHKVFYFSKIDEQKHFLVVLNPFLTFLSSVCISFTLAQVYSLVCIYHPVILHHFYAPPSFVNLGTRFLLKGEGCNTLCYGSPTYLY